MTEEDKNPNENEEIFEINYFPDSKSIPNYTIKLEERTPSEKDALVINIKPSLEDELRKWGNKVAEVSAEDLGRVIAGLVPKIADFKLEDEAYAEVRVVDKARLDLNCEPGKTFVVYQKRQKSYIYIQEMLEVDLE